MIAQVELFLQRTGLPFVVVIIDDTRSMNTVDRYDEDVRKSLEDRVAQALMPAVAGRSRRRRPQLSRWNVARMLFAENDGALADRVGREPQAAFLLPQRDEREPAHGRAGHSRRTEGGRGQRRQHPPGLRHSRRAGRASRHDARGHRAGHRRHQHRRPRAARCGRLRPPQGRAAAADRRGQRSPGPRSEAQRPGSGGRGLRQRPGPLPLQVDGRGFRRENGVHRAPPRKAVRAAAPRTRAKRSAGSR